MEWCITQRVTAFPASYESVGGFVAQKVAALHGSAKSVANIVSSLHIFSLQCNHPWLSERDLYRLTRIRKQLVLQDPVPIRRRHPLVLSMIEQIIKCYLCPKYSSYNLLQATMMLVAHNGLLRGGELLSGFKVEHVAWDHRNRSFTIHHAGPTKTVRTQQGIHVRITDYRGSKSAYQYLVKWFNDQNLWTKKGSFIFPFYHRACKGADAFFDFQQQASRKWFERITRRAVASLGVDPAEYTLHSFRAGGATDLFVIGVPYAKIKKYGRWVSDAGLVYYRDDVEVSASVAGAFGSGLYDRNKDYELGRVGVLA